MNWKSFMGDDGFRERNRVFWHSVIVTVVFLLICTASLVLPYYALLPVIGECNATVVSVALTLAVSLLLAWLLIVVFG